MRAKQRVPAPRGGTTDHLGRQRLGCDRILLQRTSLRRKIAPNKPNPANVGIRISSMTKIELMISRVSQWPATRNKMKKRNLLGLSVIVACGLALLPGSDVSQQKSLKAELAGTLTLVSVSEAYQDGRKETP